MLTRRTKTAVAAAMIAGAVWVTSAHAGPNQWTDQTPWLCFSSCQLWSSPYTPTSTYSGPCITNYEGMWMMSEVVATNCSYL